MNLNALAEQLVKRTLVAVPLATVFGLALTACGGGGGGPPPPEPEAVVTAVATDQKLEGQLGQTIMLEFVVTTSKPVVRGLVVSFNTQSTAKSGLPSTGSAVGGVACGAGVDFVTAVGSKITIPVGAQTGRITVEVCPDAVFEPNETLQVVWSSEGTSGGILAGTIINDDAGGLNSTGAATLMAGPATFGRDANSLTNASVDGFLGFSFDKSNTACTFDNVTGLSWQRAVTTNQSYAQLPAIAVAANNASVCGKTDWRVPTVNELLSLANTNVAFPGAVNADALAVTADVMSGDFWSNEVVATATTNAWVWSAANGGAVSFVSKTPSGTAPAVRLVSGSSTLSACSQPARYLSSGGAVEDKQTGLMWKQCAEGASGAQCNSPGPTAFATSAAMLSQLNLTNASPAGLGYSDWRIPTIKELASLVDRCTISLPIDSNFFPNNQSVSYISSSLNANTAGQFWYVDFAQGAISVEVPANKYLRLVRAGQ